MNPIQKRLGFLKILLLQLMHYAVLTFKIAVGLVNTNCFVHVFTV